MTATAANFSGDVTISAESDNTHFTASVSGTTVTITADANTGSDEISGMITVTATDGTVTKTAAVTVKQKSQAATIITLDFTSADNLPEGFPTSSGTKTGTYSYNGYEFVFNAAASFYYMPTGYALLIGKTGSYILTPAIEGKTLTSIAFKTGSGASEKVIVDVYDADGTISLGVNSATLKKGTEYDWSIADTEPNTSYQIRVTNNNNAQFAYLTLTFE